MNAPDIHPKLKATLDAFRASGVTLTDEEVCWLSQLRYPCDHPADGSVPWVMGSPVCDSGVKYYPLHSLAKDWWFRARKLVGGEMGEILVYLYAHAHSNRADASLSELVTSDQIADAVNKWHRQTPLHDGQLDALVNRLRELDGDSDDVPDATAKPREDQPDNRSTSQLFMGMMCKAFPGISPDYWLTGISMADARAMIDGVNEEGFAGSEKRTEAIRNYLKAVKWIWVNHELG